MLSNRLLRVHLRTKRLHRYGVLVIPRGMRAHLQYLGECKQRRPSRWGKCFVSPSTVITMAKGPFSSRGRAAGLQWPANRLRQAEARRWCLKPLSAARALADTIHAVHTAAAISSNWNHRSQRRCTGGGDREPRSTSAASGEAGYVEAHGTGLPVGEIVEARGYAGGRACGASTWVRDTTRTSGSAWKQRRASRV